MPNLYRLSGREMIYFLEKLGFTQVRQRDSHVVLRKTVPGGHIGCVVPLHPELAVRHIARHPEAGRDHGGRLFEGGRRVMSNHPRRAIEESFPIVEINRLAYFRNSENIMPQFRETIHENNR